MENNIKNLLDTNVVVFKFTKADGEERLAKGTRNIEYLLENNETGFTEMNIPSGPPKSDEVCPYWDLEKMAWRSLRFDSLVEIIEVL